jgi:hypothetical protein
MNEDGLRPRFAAHRLRDLVARTDLREDAEHAYRRGYRDGFIEAYNAVEDGLEQGGVAQVLWHLFEFWQHDLYAWQHGELRRFEEPPDFVLPDVVRRRTIGTAQRRRIVERCGFRCAYCRRYQESFTEGPDGRPWHIDHVQALARGGTHTEDNLTLACATCNSRKRDQAWR